MSREAPWLAEPAPVYAGPFHKNIVEFLGARATRVPMPASVESTEAWVVPLDATDGPVNLHIYKESYDDDPTRAACDQCRIIGAALRDTLSLRSDPLSHDMRRSAARAVARGGPCVSQAFLGNTSVECAVRSSLMDCGTRPNKQCKCSLRSSRHLHAQHARAFAHPFGVATATTARVQWLIRTL